MNSLNRVNLHTDGDVKMLADLISKMFQSLSTHLPKRQPTYQHTASIIPDKYCVLVEDVEKKLMVINTKIAVGLDRIPNWVLSDLPGYLSGPIACIFNSSFCKGYIP